ncbi:hypothetical protein VD17_02035 [Pseudomonas fluorescens]|uniref:Uncharacterized protein n=1 Tax=Pseudomonas fluorescens TaxID=294 RepID=A0A0F4VFL5_PSEFL|nr:hypothetical protein VD17_02035 [Pseudomonas fluorescens]
MITAATQPNAASQARQLLNPGVRKTRRTTPTVRAPAPRLQPPKSPLIARLVTNIARIMVQDVSDVFRVIEQPGFETPKSQQSIFRQ